MCTIPCLDFGKKYLQRGEIEGKKVLEIGSYNVNGSLRSYIESLRPAEYTGVDIEKGFGVDVVCTAESVRQRFADDSFDLVLSTELMEHVMDWRTVISNMKNLCRPGGTVLITTRSRGYRYHGWPYDYWRFEVEDMERIFSDFAIHHLEKDTAEPGVFIMARKPDVFRERDLKDVALYSVVTESREVQLSADKLASFLSQHEKDHRLAERQTFKHRVRKFVRDSYWRVTRGS